MDIKKLIDYAKQGSKNSYSPYSNFAVGASLLCKDGTYYKGCNVENASYGLANCAERTCLFTAYADGVKKDDIVAFCVYSPKENLVYPCGACRQVMSELLPLNCKVVVACGENNKYVEMEVKDLLPYLFSNEDLNND